MKTKIEPLAPEPLHLLVSLFSRCKCLEWIGRLVMLILGHILKNAYSARLYNGKKTTSLTSGAGKTGQPLVKE